MQGAVNRAEAFRGHDLMRQIVGERMSACELRNYEIGKDQYTEKRQRVLEQVTDYCRDLKSPFQTGGNLLITGGCGTGKTHLAASVVRVAVGYGFDCAFIRGSALCGEMLQRIRSDVPRNTVPLRYQEVPLLVIDDIEPRAGAPTQFEERALLELFDTRYRNRLRTVVTSNCRYLTELKERIGTRTAERLIDGSKTVITAWPSYRKAAV